MKIKKAIFMLRKLLRDFNTNRKIEINMENQSETLGYYYIKFDEDIAKLNRLIHSFDNNGVPLNTTYIDVEDTKLHYYPISIGQYGLAIPLVVKDTFRRKKGPFSSHCRLVYEQPDRSFRTRLLLANRGS